MLSINKAHKLIEDNIRKLDFKRDPQELYAPILYSLGAGGKRIRPVLCLLSCQLFSDSIADVIHPALGLEVFHNFTLLHDDIMDRAELRRGQPTVHKKWDVNTAILSGDVMQILAYEYLCKTPAQYLPEVLTVFNNTAREVCEGQQYDMDFESRKDVGTDEYLRMIELKTAVLLGASTRIGAIIGGASEEDVNHMYEFGLNLGMAFQLQDDYLDTFGSEKSFGKKIGGDIVANKKTWLFLAAIRKAKEPQKKQLIELYAIGTGEVVNKIKVVKELFKKLGVDKEARDLIQQYNQKANNSLQKVDGEGTSRTVLQELLDQLLIRKK